MRNFIRLGLFSVCISGMAWGSLISNGSFEDPVVNPTGTYNTYGVGSTAITDWTVTGPGDPGGNIALVSNGFNCCGIAYTASDGSQFLDLSGTSDNGGSKGVSQSVNLAAGTYLLTFDIGNYSDPNGSGSPNPSSINVRINGSVVDVQTNANNTSGQVNWESVSYSFAANGATTIALEATASGPDNFTGLDNVALTQVTETPEPAAFLLAGGGLLLTALRRVRRA